MLTLSYQGYKAADLWQCNATLVSKYHLPSRNTKRIMVIVAWLLLGSYLVTCVRGLFIWSTGPNIWPLDLSISVWYRYASSICLPFRAIEHWRIFWLITFWTLKVISILLDQWQSYILFYYLNNLLYQTMKCSSNILRLQHQLSVMLCCECNPLLIA